MSKIETAVQWAIAQANDPAHGYSQQSRWGPDYDCSSFVIDAMERAGIPVKSRGATYTGNMMLAFLQAGFSKVTDGSLQRGDVLLNIRSHAAIYIGGGQLVEAAHDETGGITGAQSGDQTGQEIRVTGFYDYPWDVILRWGIVQTETQEKKADTYYVKIGDSLWSIAERLLGAGYRYTEIMNANGLTSTAIYPGMQLVIPQEAPKETVSITVDVLRRGNTGAGVRAVQKLLGMVNETGEFGAETEAAVMDFQRAQGIAEDGIIGAETWPKLLGGE